MTDLKQRVIEYVDKRTNLPEYCHSGAEEAVKLLWPLVEALDYYAKDKNSPGYKALAELEEKVKGE